MANAKQDGDKSTLSSVKVRYETTDINFVSQFMINAGAEELIINFSPGYLHDPNSQDNILPVHSRIAMTYGGAKRLAQSLNQALQNVSDKQQTATGNSAGDGNSGHEASLPKFS